MKSQSNKKQVLVFMLAPPLPAVAGGDIYAVNALIPFSDDIDYHLFCYIGGEHDIEKVNKHSDAYRKVFRSVHLEPRPLMPFQLPKLRRALRMVSHVFQGLPFIDASYCSRSAVNAARAIVRQKNIDALEVNSAHLAFFKKFLPHVPAVLVGHNIELDIFPFWIPAGLSGWKLKFMEWVAARSRAAARAVELDNSFGFSAMTFISRNDMGRVTGAVPKYLMPLSFDVASDSYPEQAGEVFNVLWMGGFGWYPNAEGVSWFVSEILPGIKSRLAEKRIVLHFCGGNPSDQLLGVADSQNIFVHGFVEDIDSMVKSAHLLMVPLLSGGGIRVKIVEAMSAGLPVLSTSKGCEGIGATNGLNVVIRDDAQGFGEMIVSLSDSFQELARLSEEGKELMRRDYSRSASLQAKRAAYLDAGIL